ncbi:MAG: YdcF family protein [Verrucomicrobiae bacterium]|nr:YdcF family protein [Verrucomicrobiae bacterium]
MKTSFSRPWFAPRTVVLPTGRGWLAILGGVGLSVWAITVACHPFLAVEERFPDGPGTVDLLCVEGWSSESVIDAVAEAYKSGKYGRIAVTGGPTQSRERLIGFASYAALGAFRLERRGVPADRIIVSEPAYADRRRTLNDILELRRTLRMAGVEPCRLQIFSTSVHTRRTRLLYRRVFGTGTEIRALALPPEDYDPEHWWATSEGLKTVVMESISLAFDSLAPVPALEAIEPVNLTGR